jgi:hypothetical protein
LLALTAASQAYSPGIKHHRIPAPEMSFIRPNIPALVGEIESLIRKIESEAEAKRV